VEQEMDHGEWGWARVTSVTHLLPLLNVVMKTELNNIGNNV
jgi:hypothetical protein